MDNTEGISFEDKKQQTVDAYNKSAESIANKFNEQGARVTDIEESFALVKKENPNVFEIGCGNGRDAKKITEHTNNYFGVDISEGLIKLAREKVPTAKFEIADIEQFTFPKPLDLIFAFASLLHVNKENLARVLEQAHESLNEGGVFRISLKYAPRYQELLKEDQFGSRTFYFYSEEDIKEILNHFKILKMEVINVRGQDWIEIILQK